MPIYEYKCRQCEYKFEQLVSSNTAESDIKCPKCGTHSPVKLFSSFSSKAGGASCSIGSSS